MWRIALLVLVACEAKPGEFRVDWALRGGIEQWQAALATVCHDLKLGAMFPFRDIESVRSTRIYDCVLLPRWKPESREGAAIGHLDYDGRGRLTRITLHARTRATSAFELARAIIGAYTATPQPVPIQGGPFALSHYEFTVERAQHADAAAVVIEVRAKVI